MDYELYHDESKVDGYWHGMLLVPCCNKTRLIDYLKRARNNTNYFHPIKLKNVKVHGKLYDCVDAWLQLGVASLIQIVKGQRHPVFVGKRVRGSREYVLFHDLVKAKFVLFRERDDHIRMTGHQDYGSKVETTFRMGFKGGLHCLGSDSEPIQIKKIHFDGHEHYQRRIDKERIIGKLSGLRSYCSIDDSSDLIDDQSANHTKDKSQPYEDCQLLQLTDVLVGSFRTVLGQPTRDIHLKLAEPADFLIYKYVKGKARMDNSRWRNSFCISQCYLEDNGWTFDTIEYQILLKTRQTSLF
jgi:hypothetical protein